ncbi:peptidase [Novosphingobium umbonatum]|uniref:Peptidase n=1 Tax=Novosphingobium umbonatum TaxID=1908524 RepID=A0A3S2VPC2_9SPHN|nr:prolyl oligopeptidase family serine peptidase [Novosphingobium umbonatum]RVU02173.1 peptidase [Novosphingobium umbonatum]
MADVSRRDFVATSTALAGIATVAQLGAAQDARAQGGFQAANSAGTGEPDDDRQRKPGLQSITAICEVTGGGQKVYGIAVAYDVAIDPASLTKDSFVAGVVPAAKGYFPGMPQTINKNATTEPARQRAVAAIYTNDKVALRPDGKSVVGPVVILEFAHDEDLSLLTSDSDMVMLSQNKPVRTIEGTTYAASDKPWSNVGRRGNHVAIRGVDAWEQSHWWWDDKRSAWLEYSIYLPQSFLKSGGETKAYPLVLAITHSGTTQDGTCAQTLTEQCIASIWSMPEEQDRHECVVITPRYERTTLNDYWEHTADVENTWKLIQSLLSNTWNYGNPNRPDRADKVLKIDPKRVYCTGWSMGAMTSLWIMARHPDTFAGGLIIAGQQRPADVVTLAHQNLLIITGTEDGKATPWNEKCVPVWEKAGGKVTRPARRLDPGLIFPVGDQKVLSAQVEGYLAEGGNITYLTFQGVDHMASARKFFYIQSARDWLFRQVK